MAMYVTAVCFPTAGGVLLIRFLVVPGAWLLDMDGMNNRGGPGRGQGRKPLAAGEETLTVSLRMTAAQREKLKRLGGAKWMRDRIDRAKEPNVKVQG